MIGKALFENEIKGVIQEHQSRISAEEIAEILWKLANQVIVEKEKGKG